MNTRIKLGKVQAVVVVASLLASFFVGFASPAQAAISIFINEIHYDNASTDEGEAIEIAGPAGTDLAGWSIALYNGSSTQLNVYDTITLSGVLPDQQDGFGTLAFFRAGIQNGAPDGMALVDSSSTVVQFLSYEGSFTAVDGPAAGMTSTDIGVAEGSSTPVGYSLQLVGTGSIYEDFTWADPVSNTFDAVNTGQTFSGSGPDYTPIYDIQYTTDPSGDSPYKDQVGITTEGIVTALFYNGYFIEDTASGAWNGLWVYDSNTPALGDRVRLTGTVDEYYNLTELKDLTSYDVVSSGNPLPGPVVLATSDVSQEQWESVLVRVENVTVTNPDLGNGEWEVDDGSGPAVVDDMGDYTYAPTLNDELDYVQGPLNYSYGAFKIEPRDDSDIGLPQAYTPIYDIQYTEDPSGDSPYAGQTVTTQGIVTAVFYGGDRVWIQDGTGAWNGLYLYVPSPAPTIGDRIEVTGDVIEYNGLTEMENGVVTILSSGNPLPDPSIVTTLDLNQEMWESVLVRVENVTVTNPDLGYGEWEVDDGTGPAVVDDMGDYTYVPALDDELDYVQGPLNYNYGVFKIEPRDDDDIGLPAPPSALVINEILADPAGDLTGDANGDGIRDSSEDEFVEIVNNSDSNLDISGWTLADGYGVRHTFPADTVVSANCAIVVFGGGTPTGSFGNAVVQTASTGSLGLNNSGDTVTINDGTTDLVAVTYGSEGGDNQSLTRDPDITGEFVKHSTATGSGGALFSPGTMIDGSSFPGCGAGFGVCSDPATFIHEVQGNGDASPLNGTPDVVIEGVVVGDFQDTSTQLSGFFLQEENDDADTDPMTSEGVFVYDNGFLDVNVGDVVRVMGDVTEYYELTELNNVSGMLICDPGPVATAAAVTLPIADTAEWEWYEGMLINIPGPLYATGNYSQGRYGEVDLSINDRLDNPTNVVAPGTPANDLQEINDRSRIQLEDGSTLQNPVPAPYIGDGNTLRAGDTIPELTGVLHYGFGSYELHPTGAVNFARVNTRDATPPDVGGTLKVASFNVLNYFTTLDDSGPICGPSGGMDCRGADTAEEFTRQRDKIIAAIITMDADVIGLMEMENHPTDDALQNLVDGLNDIAGSGTYALINTGTIGTDAIKVAFIYKLGTVTPVGPFAILDSSVDPLFLDTKNRPALAQTFEQNATGETFTAVVNHLKSKGSPCDDVGDPDMGDGQGNCNLTRTNAAIALTNWLATDPTGSGDSDFLIIGDLNAYAMEDPITAIKDAGYTNLIETLVGADAYSYVFYGQAGYLDHSLATASLTDQVTGVVEWHINADEPAALDYNDYNQPDLYNPDAYRASDHDPVIVGLALQPETVPFETFKIRYASIRWKDQKCADGYFTILGQLELPEGYTRDDLTRDLELMLTIKGEDADDTVTMKERRRVWYYHGKLDHPIEGLQLTKALILWPRPGDSRPPVFTLRGAFSMPGVDHKTRPAEAIVNLSLPVANAQLAEQVVGEKLVKFRTYHRLWLYSPWLKHAKIYVHDLPR